MGKNKMYRRRFDFGWNINSYRAGRKLQWKNNEKSLKKVLTNVE